MHAIYLLIIGQTIALGLEMWLLSWLTRRVDTLAKIHALQQAQLSRQHQMLISVLDLDPPSTPLSASSKDAEAAPASDTRESWSPKGFHFHG